MGRPKGSKNKSSRLNSIPEVPKQRCLHCGMELEYKHFNKSSNRSDIYSGNDNYMPICRDCMKILYEQYKVLYMNQFSVLGTELKENEIEKLAVRRLCMTFDIYYSDSLFDAALKQTGQFSNLDLVTAYMRISNLKQSKGKSYDNTILEENMSQELLKAAMVDKIKGQFDDDELYQDIYNLCLKLLRSLKKNCNIDVKNNDCTND